MLRLGFDKHAFTLGELLFGVGVGLPAGLVSHHMAKPEANETSKLNRTSSLAAAVPMSLAGAAGGFVAGNSLHRFPAVRNRPWLSMAADFAPMAIGGAAGGASTGLLSRLVRGSAKNKATEDVTV